MKRKPKLLKAKEFPSLEQLNRNEYYYRLLEQGWEPPTNSTEGWKPPIGTFLREIWNVPIEEYPELKAKWNREHPENQK